MKSIFEEEFEKFINLQDSYWVEDWFFIVIT